MCQCVYVEILSTWEAWRAQKRHKSCSSLLSALQKSDLHMPQPAQFAEVTTTTTTLAFPYFWLTHSKVFSL